MMNGTKDTTGSPVGSLAVWLRERLRRVPRVRPRLALVERIALGPRQSLALVEADGRRLLVATSAEGPSAFYTLDGRQYRITRPERRSPNANSTRRVSW